MPTYSYEFAPFRRMAWDEDGTVFVHAATSASNYTSIVLPGTEENTTRKGYFNNEQTPSLPGGADVIGIGSFVSAGQFRFFAMIFPELRDIYGTCYWAPATLADEGDPRRRNAPAQLQVSTNSINGVSGTWTDIYPGIGDPPGGSQGVGPVTYPILATWWTHSWEHFYRDYIVDWPVTTDVRAIRWLTSPGENLIGNASFHHMHVYGDKSAGATPDRLLFIDETTGLEFQAPHDWGDLPRGVTLDHPIKIMNNSATLTANDIDLTFEALTGFSHTWHSLSDSGAGFAGSLNITSIAPGAEYPAADVITLRITVAGDENMGPNSCRIQASTTSWT